MDSGNQVYAIYANPAKAFDCVNHYLFLSQYLKEGGFEFYSFCLSSEVPWWSQIIYYGEVNWGHLTATKGFR